MASGELDVIKLSQHAKPVVIIMLAKGNSIGEMALIDKLTRSASVRACTPTNLIVLTRKTSDKLAEFMPPLT